MHSVVERFVQFVNNYCRWTSSQNCHINCVAVCQQFRIISNFSKSYLLTFCRRMTTPKESSSDNKDEDEEEEDPFYTIIENSGCSKYHYALQDCYIEKKDWRECKKEMEEFRRCNEAQQKLKKRKGTQK